jgi:hypothetical protein
MPASLWSAIPEDILFLILKIIDDDDTDVLVIQLDHFGGCFSRKPWFVRRAVKPGIRAVRQACSRWRSIATATLETFPLQIAMLLWRAQDKPENIEKDIAAVRDELFNYDRDIDYGIRAGFNNIRYFDFLHSAIIMPCGRQLRLLGLDMNFYTNRNITLSGTFPRLSHLIYTWYMAGGVMSSVPISAELTRSPTMIAKPVSLSPIPPSI